MLTALIISTLFDLQYAEYILAIYAVAILATYLIARHYDKKTEDIVALILAPEIEKIWGVTNFLAVRTKGKMYQYANIFITTKKNVCTCIYNIYSFIIEAQKKFIEYFLALYKKVLWKLHQEYTSILNRGKNIGLLVLQNTQRHLKEWLYTRLSMIMRSLDSGSAR